MPTDPLLRIASDLYALVPGEFVARRTAAVATAREDGDKQLAARISDLRKPSVAAWVVNQLVRHEGEQMEQLLAVGESLRRAQADLDATALRELGRQRRQLTAAVARQGSALADRLGVTVSEQVVRQVEDTLHAAMLDEDAAAAVRSGLLSEPLSPTGLGFELSAVLADPAAAEATDVAAPALSVVPDDEGTTARAQEAVDAAAAAAAQARKKRDKATRKVERAQARVLQLQAELEELHRHVAELEHEVDGAADEVERLRDKQERADGRAAEAEQAELSARERLDGGGSGAKASGRPRRT